MGVFVRITKVLMIAAMVTAAFKTFLMRPFVRVRQSTMKLFVATAMMIIVVVSKRRQRRKAKQQNE